MRKDLGEKMAGEITLSKEPGLTIRKWREIFEVSQTDLARYLKESPSVISDYENCRRHSPGTKTVKKIVESLLDIDEQRGGKVIKRYGPIAETADAIIDVNEFSSIISTQDFVKLINGKVVVNDHKLTRGLMGYTIIDSIKAITSFGSFEYSKIYGWSSERALIFTGIKYGRSPMIAVRVHPMKPAMVVYHEPESIDKLALHLAEIEGIPLVATELPLNELIKKLKSVC